MITRTYSSPIAVSVNDKLIWVVNPGEDSVSVIRPDNNTRLAKIVVGDEPQSVALTPDNQYAYVANAAAGTVTVIKINDPLWGTFSAVVDTSVGSNGQLTTGAEPWNIVCSPDGKRVFVANSGQDTITVIDTATRSIVGNVNLRNSLANDPERSRHFQPRGLAVTADNSKLYVTDVLTSKVFVSTDGSNWQLSNNGFNVGAAPLAITVFNGRLYVGETLNPGRVYVSTDGNSWYPPQGGFGVTGNSNGIHFVGKIDTEIAFVVVQPLQHLNPSKGAVIEQDDGDR